MDHSGQKCHISVLNGVFWDMGQVHFDLDEVFLMGIHSKRRLYSCIFCKILSTLTLYEHIVIRLRYQLLTCWIVSKIVKDVFIFRIISWILFNRRRPNSQWSNPTCCIYDTVNSMPADTLATLAAKASAGVIFTTNVGISRLQHQKS